LNGSASVPTLSDHGVGKVHRDNLRTQCPKNCQTSFNQNVYDHFNSASSRTTPLLKILETSGLSHLFIPNLNTVQLISYAALDYYRLSCPQINRGTNPMAVNLIIKYDPTGDILYINKCPPYAEQESEELGDDIIVRVNPKTDGLAR
jgi:hypothetical protein